MNNNIIFYLFKYENQSAFAKCLATQQIINLWKLLNKLLFGCKDTNNWWQYKIISHIFFVSSIELTGKNTKWHCGKTEAFSSEPLLSVHCIASFHPLHRSLPSITSPASIHCISRVCWEVAPLNFIYPQRFVWLEIFIYFCKHIQVEKTDFYEVDGTCW